MVTVFAPAKVNLFLHVVGRRADGYHLLDSLVAFAGVGDTITAEPADGLTLTVDGPTGALAPADDGNIVLKAARALAAHEGVTKGAAIRLTKRLPVAAGIGGGSADAAATLTALTQLWGLPPANRSDLALSLGADVPVCLRGTSTQMSGVGEILKEVPTLPPAWLVLVNPMQALSTPSVFKARTGCFSEPAPLETTPRDAAHLAQLLAARKNDLTDAAISLAPAVGEALPLIEGTPGCLLARMSGSGATCFGLYASGDEAETAAAAIAAAKPDWWVAPAPLLG